MIPLRTNRRVLTWFCVYPPEENATKWQKRAYIAFAVYALTLNSVSCVSDAAFFFKFVSTDLEKSLMALLQLFGNATMVYALSITFLLRKKFVAIIESLTTIYETSKSKIYLSRNVHQIGNYNCNEIQMKTFRCKRGFVQVLGPSQ